MINVKLSLISIMLLSGTCIINTRGTTNRICSFDCCEYSQNPKRKVVIETLSCPSQAEWRSQKDFDEIDKLIFTNRSFPYSYQDIMSVPDTEVHVIRADYEII